MKRSTLGICAVSVSLLAAGSAQADITFVANYTDGPTEGFNDATLGAQRKAAFEFGLNIWSQQFANTYVGETVTVNAAFDALPGGVLGGAGAVNLWNVGGTAYGSALANHIVGSDLHTNAEISATFNSSFADWYLGTDGNTPFDKWDFVTVVLHEVGHGLNFFDLINQNGTWAVGLPGIYDRFLETGAGTDLSGMSDAQRAAAIISNDLFWNGAEGMAENGGNRPRMYAPGTYQGGSSVSHLDPTAHPNFLMNPGIFNGTAIHSPSAMELGMFADMGWNLIPEPAAFALFGLAGLVLLRRRTA